MEPVGDTVTEDIIGVSVAVASEKAASKEVMNEGCMLMATLVMGVDRGDIVDTGISVMVASRITVLPIVEVIEDRSLYIEIKNSEMSVDVYCLLENHIFRIKVYR